MQTFLQGLSPTHLYEKFTYVTSKQIYMKKLLQQWNEKLKRWNFKLKLEEYAKASSYAIHR